MKIVGCVPRAEFLPQVNETVKRRLERLPEKDRTDPVVLNRVQMKLATELIFSLPLHQVILTQLAGAFNSLFQTSFY